MNRAAARAQEAYDKLCQGGTCDIIEGAKVFLDELAQISRALEYWADDAEKPGESIRIAIFNAPIEFCIYFDGPLAKIVEASKFLDICPILADGLERLDEATLDILNDIHCFGAWAWDKCQDQPEEAPRPELWSNQGI